jgi:hypothetical protein
MEGVLRLNLVACKNLGELGSKMSFLYPLVIRRIRRKGRGRGRNHQGFNNLIGIILFYPFYL